MHLFAEPPLQPNAETISHQQHEDQQFRVNGWPPLVLVEVREMTRMLPRPTN